MGTRGYMLLAAGLLFGGLLLGQAQRSGSSKKPVDVKADVAYRTPNLDKNAVIMVGGVVFHQNGAAISCDSAVRYSDRRIECFKNVIINKGNTYVYGDRAVYNGEINTARVYSPMVKVIDGDATLYTYNFSFNTATNVGTWFGGGVMYQKDNVLESEKGYLYSERDELVAVHNVEMKNNSHTIISDSVRYNSRTKIANFYTKTYIWTRDGEIISAEKGRYNTQDSTYFFWQNAYILTDFRETWADTIDFAAKPEDAVFYGNIQIDDNENESSAFGDYGQYWGERGETMLTKRPTLTNYNDQQGSDTLYMSADTIYMFVVYPSDSPRRDIFAEAPVDPFAYLAWTDSLPDSVRIAMADSLRPIIAALRAESDSLRHRADSIMTVLYPPPAVPLVEVDTLLSRGGLSALDSLPAIDSLPPADTLSPADSISVPSAEPKLKGRAARRQKRSRGPNAEPWLYSELWWSYDPLANPTLQKPAAKPAPLKQAPGTLATAPATTAETERIEPPEVQSLRARVTELVTRADSLAGVEGYLRSKIESVAAPVDSLAIRTADSLARVDSLGRIDSIRIADPKAYKKLEKAHKKRLKAREKREKEAAREAELDEKDRLREQKLAVRDSIRAGKQAIKEAERAERLAQRRRRVGWVTETPYSDSIARMDSIRKLDSLTRLQVDSLEKIPKPDTTAAAEPDSTMRIFRGWHNVKIWRKDVQAVGDSMVGFSVDSTLHLYVKPVLWYGESQVVADSITAFVRNESFDRAEFYGDPIMANELSPREHNQVKGRTMTAWFRDNAVYRHDVYGNAEALYYVQEEQQDENGETYYTDPVALIVATSSDMTFLIENRFIRYIIAREQVEWPVYPIDDIPQTQPTELKGFRWYPERRPVLEDVFTRNVRPSERTTYETKPLPEFPIAARILRRREYLIANRMWGDRTDPLPAHAVEFVRSLK